MPVLFSAALSGFLLAASLIIAIGAQNAFILRQGLLREHVFLLCLLCSMIDALLITAGVAGLGTLIAGAPALIWWVTLGGAIFLSAYALIAFGRAFHPGALHAAGESGGSLKQAVLTCLALTLLNPHVYLDTVVLLGALSARYHGTARLAYGLGAAAASFVWFFAVGYGARLLQPVFARPSAWRVLDVLIGGVMATLAFNLYLRL